jgi:nucleoside-diphosphate-sugar epimerase
VYGPRDAEFLRLFKAVKSHVLPDFGGGRQALSLVYVRDLAEAIITCLQHPGAAGQTFFVSGSEVVTARQFGEMIARELGVRVWRLPLPVGFLWPVCLVQELISRCTRTPNVVSRQKYAELRAPGWVCDGSRLRRELGVDCATRLREGVTQTAQWYRHEGWL